METRNLDCWIHRLAKVVLITGLAVGVTGSVHAESDMDGDGVIVIQVITRYLAYINAQTSPIQIVCVGRGEREWTASGA